MTCLFVCVNTEHIFPAFMHSIQYNDYLGSEHDKNLSLEVENLQYLQ